MTKIVEHLQCRRCGREMKRYRGEPFWQVGNGGKSARDCEHSWRSIIGEQQ